MALALLLLAGAALAAPAANEAPPLRDYAIDAWTTRNGLPHNSLRGIAQTPDGYLWFALWEGVVRYNGVAFSVLDRGSKPGLRDNGIGALYVDPRGQLWLSDSRGNLGRLEQGGRWTFVERSPQWPQALVHDMAMDAHGRLWLLFEGHGLGCVHPGGRFEYFPPPAQVPLQASFPRMVVDAQDRIWVGTLDGLVMRDARGQWHRFGAESGLPPGLVWPYRAADGILWLVAEGQLFRLDGERIVAAHALAGSGHITAMLADRQGALWIGTENRGVARIGAHGLEWLSPGEVLPRGRIVSLLEDAEGSIWIGANGGLFRLRETLFTGYTRRDGLGQRLRARRVRGSRWRAVGRRRWRARPPGVPTAVSIRCRCRAPRRRRCSALPAPGRRPVGRHVRRRRLPAARWRAVPSLRAGRWRAQWPCPRHRRDRRRHGLDRYPSRRDPWRCPRRARAPTGGRPAAGSGHRAGGRR